jgi:flagellar motor switch protein FliN/FliY
MADSDVADRGHPFTRVPVEITVSVGRARPLIKDLLDLGPEAVLPLDRRIDDPVELYLGDRLIAARSPRGRCNC